MAIAMGKRSTSSPKKVRGFLVLSGEIRNHIYDYYFEEKFRAELAAKGSKLQVGTEKDCPRTIRMSHELGRYKRADGMRTQWTSSLTAIIYVCKLVYSETRVFLYTNTTFVSDSPKRIQSFLSAVPKMNLELVTKLKLNYESYKDPKRREFVPFQDKHQASWDKTCKTISKKLVNLRELEIFIYHTGDHFFSLRHKYIQPLLQFRRFSCKHGSKAENQLKSVKVHFRTFWTTRFTDPNITNASVELHDLFAEAIGLLIEGWSEDDAMANLNEAWQRHRQWHHHLMFLHTGW